LYSWRPDDTYIQPSPLFEGDVKIGDIIGARPLLILGDNITTDHISPAGNITPDNPAGQFLLSLGVKPSEFNTFGARRGNWQVMVRGTFSSKGYKNKIGNLDGGLTIKFPEGKVMTVYEAAEAYKREGTPVIVLAGKNYGAGSSRDWAAKGPKLLGVKAVIAESFERIHRSNLTMVGIIPIQLPPGVTVDSLNLDGSETFDIVGLSEGLAPGKEVTIRIHRKDGRVDEVKARLAIYTWAEVEYIKHGGILPYVLKKLLQKT
jgi:aconitate hydratase